MKNVILLLILLTSNFVISQKSDNQNRTDGLGINETLKKIDSLKFSELDFNKMKNYYSENTELNKLIFKKTSSQYKNAINFLELKSLSYQKAIDKVGKNEINKMIYVYYQTVIIKEEFDKLDRELDLMIDSLKLRNEYLKKEIQKDKKIIDSLKNN